MAQLFATGIYTTIWTLPVIPLYVVKRRKAQKQRGSWAKSTYGHCIKEEVLIDKPNSRNQRYRKKAT